MELQDSILKDFADAVNSESVSMPPSSQHIYGTVSRISNDDGLVYVTINGAEIDTPAKSLVKVGLGDVVLCTMQGHTLTVIGNVSYPALTRVENVYMTLTQEGLLIGKLTEDNKPYESYIVVGPYGTSVYNIDGEGNGVLVASFGETAQLGKSSTTHLTMTSNGLAIRNGTDNGDYILANFTPTGMSFRDGNGNVLASFTRDSITIGPSSNATINMCNGSAVIGLSSGTLKISGGNNVEAIGLSNSYGNYKSEVVCEAKNGSHRTAMQLLNGSSTISSVILSDNGANVTVPSGKALTENGVEVVKVDGVVATGVLNLNSKTVSKGWVGTVDQVVSVPNGYKLVGICGITSAQYDGTQSIGSWHVTSSDNTIHLKIDTSNATSQTLNLNYSIRWFAIGTSGITSGGSSSIDW